MERIEIQPDWVQEVAAAFRRCASDLTEVSRDIATLPLDTELAGEGRAAQRLRRTASGIEEESQALLRLARFLEESAAAYEDAERRLTVRAEEFLSPGEETPALAVNSRFFTE